MIGRIEATLRRWRRHFSRSEWLARLLNLPVSIGTATLPGLVLVQIDGLSHSELQQALQRGEMPFLRRLIESEHYQLQHVYAGVPSTTPAVQGEIFYGVKAVVPGFNFMPHESNRLVRMFEPAAAVAVEKKLEQQCDRPLLAEGSCYADNFTGGAAEPHFCPASLGWGSAMRNSHPLALLFFIISNAYSFLRTAVLMLLESLLAAIDFVRGLIDGHDILAELKFIPTRVGIVILLRELITIGVKVDVARGLPVIHVNFLGYDEQAHRRGPASLFAHWTLQGIDDAIARIWRATQRSSRRSYDVWVYSDHGQQQVLAYHKLYGRSFSEAVVDVFSQHEDKAIDYQSSGHTGIQLQRIRMLGGKRTQRFFGAQLKNRKNGNRIFTWNTNAMQLSIAPLGPMAHLYFDRRLTQRESSALAHALVTQAHVPMLLHRNTEGSVRATTQAGEFSLAEHRVALLGADHPYLDAVCDDLIALCEHPDAGQFIASGYCPGGQAVSFAIENGAHGGPGKHETSAFALLPGDISLRSLDDRPVRPGDLRNAALTFLGRSGNRGQGTGKVVTESHSQPAASQLVMAGATSHTIRIMTYNVHSCIGMDGKLAPERIARVIARYAPDIVALQELDVGRLRTNDIDQAHCIAAILEMNFCFHPAMHIEEERYGDAIMTHLPMRMIKSAILPGLARKPMLEPRGALWVAIDINGTEVQLLNTHLGLNSQERKAQVECLLGNDWLGHPDCRSPVVLCGDFNARPGSAEWSQLHKRLPDAQLTLANHKPKNTFFSRFPRARIDHVFVDSGVRLINIEAPAAELVRVASDHLPLIVDIALHDAD